MILTHRANAFFSLAVIDVCDGNSNSFLWKHFVKKIEMGESKKNELDLNIAIETYTGLLTKCIFICYKIAIKTGTACDNEKGNTNLLHTPNFL